MGSHVELEQQAELICEFGTETEQLPEPPDGMVKALSGEFRDFVQQHTQYELVERQFSYYGQIETTYFVTESAADEFEKPQATVEKINEDKRVVTHYTTASN